MPYRDSVAQAFAADAVREIRRIVALAPHRSARVSDDREKRLAEQLRRNLQRRKQQARSRREDARDAADGRQVNAERDERSQSGD